MIVLWSIYGAFFVVVATAYNIIKSERDQRQEYCDNRSGILIQDKSGEFYCIRQKSIIK